MPKGASAAGESFSRDVVRIVEKADVMLKSNEIFSVG